MWRRLCSPSWYLLCWHKQPQLHQPKVLEIEKEILYLQVETPCLKLPPASCGLGSSPTFIFFGGGGLRWHSLHLLHSPKQQMKHVSAHRCVACVHVFENFFTCYHSCFHMDTVNLSLVSWALKAWFMHTTAWKPTHCELRPSNSTMLWAVVLVLSCVCAAAMDFFF